MNMSKILGAAATDREDRRIWRNQVEEKIEVWKP